MIWLSSVARATEEKDKKYEPSINTSQARARLTMVDRPHILEVTVLREERSDVEHQSDFLLGILHRQPAVVFVLVADGLQLA